MIVFSSCKNNAKRVEKETSLFWSFDPACLRFLALTLYNFPIFVSNKFS